MECQTVLKEYFTKTIFQHPTTFVEFFKRKGTYYVYYSIRVYRFK